MSPRALPIGCRRPVPGGGGARARRADPARVAMATPPFRSFLSARGLVGWRNAGGARAGQCGLTSLFLKYLVTASRARGLRRRAPPPRAPHQPRPRPAAPGAPLPPSVRALVCLFVSLFAWRPLPPPGFGLCCAPPPPPSPLLPPPALVRPFRWRSRGAPRGFPVPPPPPLPGSAGGGTGGTPRSPPRAEPPRGRWSPRSPAQPRGSRGFRPRVFAFAPAPPAPARLCLYRESGRQFPASGITGRTRRGIKSDRKKSGCGRVSLNSSSKGRGQRRPNFRQCPSIAVELQVSREGK